MADPLSYSPFTRKTDTRVRRYIASREVLRTDEDVVVGISGGPDSTALLVILSRLGLTVSAAHFDHKLRSREEARADLAYVGGLCEALGVELTAGSGDVAGRALSEKESVEDAARKLRYRFLGQVAKKAGATAVAVGHTQDDRAETVLMHVIRGSGLDGLAAMPPRAPWPFGRGPEILRPLLCLTREDMVRYCRETGIAPREDPTNALPIATRNRVRSDLMPVLRQFNGRIDEALGRLADAAADDADFIAGLVEEVWPRVAAPSQGEVEMDARALAAMPRALSLRLLRKAATVVAPESSPSAQQLEAVLAACGKARPSSVPLPGGGVAGVSRGRLTVTRGDR